MSFKLFFERTDPDELYRIHNPEVVTFALFPGVGYIFTYNKSTTDEYVSINHRGMYARFPGKLIGLRKLLVTHGLLKTNTYFYLEPGQSMQTLMNRIHIVAATDKIDQTMCLEGRVYKSQVAFWAARQTVLKGNHGMLERLLKDLGKNPNEMTYNFADVGDITYDQLSDKNTKSSKDDEEEMERLRQIHLNPQMKSQIIPKNNKAGSGADQQGFKSIAQMRANKIVGDSVGF